MKYILQVITIILFTSAPVLGQILEPSDWEVVPSKKSVEIGQELDIIFRAEIDEDWYLYSSDFDPDCGPIVTSFTFEPNDSYRLVEEVKAIDPIEKFDEIFECNVRIFKKNGEFRQKIKVLADDLKISGHYNFQVCSEVTGQCIPFEYDFNLTDFQVTGTPAEDTTPKNYSDEANAEAQTQKQEIQKNQENDTQLETDASSGKDQPTTEEIEQQQTATFSKEIQGPILDESLNVKSKKDKSIIWFMVFAFIAGLAALLTPCVFPMIPMTVTYFTGKSGGTFKAMMYGFSIIFIYTIIGSAIAPLMGPETANHLSTEWLPNLIFFIIFVVFALSFFGLFDITLPSSFVNKMDEKADRKGLLGVFFMAFTLVLVSFSCTGPIVGSILVGSAGGEV
ncbi:MAG: protein-disulfide reductase DsbD family protein, partial [Fulvivirga sp.]|nr:protein-disulfide reductase DsbD family protein [Fulvivirga sp.]